MLGIAHGTAAFILAAGVTLAPLAASAQTRERASPDAGVSITIRKGPSYLNTRTIARPKTSVADYQTSALYQSTTPTRGPGGFERYPLPSTFTLPGY
ncbi:hypothetical protein [Methylopila turkensis]|uniref:Uncharacterized protein n=1 Tax=Methylopila turkensis TaxID=1437816 RepID=A0A9W6JPC6_9HYPH|nr:hypothetical protein [Methylopila turkensis]GLK79414.1 hypothetical protein GCM10008174_11550 [Methylopila turkensis]